MTFKNLLGVTVRAPLGLKEPGSLGRTAVLEGGVFSARGPRRMVVRVVTSLRWDCSMHWWTWTDLGLGFIVVSRDLFLVLDGRSSGNAGI